MDHQQRLAANLLDKTKHHRGENPQTLSSASALPVVQSHRSSQHKQAQLDFAMMTVWCSGMLTYIVQAGMAATWAVVLSRYFTKCTVVVSSLPASRPTDSALGDSAAV